MSGLFEISTLGNLGLRNRFVRSATWLGMADEDGACTPRLTEVLVKLAQGGVGLIITGFAYVSREGQSAPAMLGCHHDGLLPRLAELTQAVHRAGGKVALQVVHGGLMSPPGLIERVPLGPSALLTEKGPVGRAMMLSEIQDTVNAFAAASTRAVKAGFDAVQIHAAHGYLLSQFLSPYFNKRADAYGGPLENRVRLLVQVVRAVREAVDGAVPVLVKLNSDDLLPGGFSVGDMLKTCASLQQEGIDAIELSGGTTLGLSWGKPEICWAPVGRARPYWRGAAAQLKARSQVPVMLVGGIRSIARAEELLAEGRADYISLCRPLICQPDLVSRWETGDREDAWCRSCNACLWAGIRGEGVHCTRNLDTKAG